jgi:hypothetical protein
MSRGRPDHARSVFGEVESDHVDVAIVRHPGLDADIAEAVRTRP